MQENPIIRTKPLGVRARMSRCCQRERRCHMRKGRDLVGPFDRFDRLIYRNTIIDPQLTVSNRIGNLESRMCSTETSLSFVISNQTVIDLRRFIKFFSCSHREQAMHTSRNVATREHAVSLVEENIPTFKAPNLLDMETCQDLELDRNQLSVPV